MLTHDLDLERELLGAAMVSEVAMLEASAILPAEALTEQHATVWAACKALVAEGAAVNELTVSDRLRMEGGLERAGGASYVSSLTDSLPDVTGVGYVARRLRTMWRAREVRAALLGALADIDSGADPEKAVWSVVESCTSVDSAGETVRGAGDVAAEVVDDVLAGPGDDTVLDWGLLGHLFLPIHAGATYTVAGATGTGKSALCDQLAIHAARRGWPAVIVGLEMTAWQRAARLLSHLSGIGVGNILSRRLGVDEESGLQSVSSILGDLPVFLAGRGGAGLGDVVSAIRRAKLLYNVRLAVVDYVQLVDGGGKHGSRQAEVSHVSRTLTRLAVDLDVAMILAAQLSRRHEHEKRAPELRDLRESGSIEQDSDTVVMLHKGESNSVRQCYIRKQRFGATGSVRLLFRGSTLTFEAAATAGLDNLEPGGW